MDCDGRDDRCRVSVVVKEQRWLADEALAGSPQHDGDTAQLHGGSRLGTSFPTPTLEVRKLISSRRQYS
jgi:hypothetical protein